MKTDLELKQLAIDLADGKIFSDRHVSSNEKTSLGMVFMPLVLGGLSELDESERKDINFIYEYLTEAGPRSINGMPCFMSMRYLKYDESVKMFGYYNKYVKEKEQFLKNA